MSKLILVDITDKSYGRLGQKSELLELKGDGKLVIKNPSQKSRLWNIACDVKETVNTSISGKVLNVGALNPNQEYVEGYNIQNLKEPSLKVAEAFDTEREITDAINNVFLYQNKNTCKIKLLLTNMLDKPISDIKLVREMPALLQDIEILTPNLGSASLKEEGGSKSLVWDVPSIDARLSAELIVQCVVNPDVRTDLSLGALEVTYLVNNHILTRVAPEIRGITDSMSGTTREESSTPGSWDCNVEYVNDSEFKTLLEEVKVTHKIPTGAENVVSETPNQEIEADASWDHNFKVDASNVPELESTIEFTTLYEVITREIGQIKKESTIYHVISAEIVKTINPPEVGAYANTDMNIINTIESKGTADIEMLTILDEIPADFVPPTLQTIKVDCSSQSGTLILSDRAEYIKKIDIEPNDQNPDAKHVISVRLKGLSKQVKPGSIIKMSYPLLAKNPKPGVEYKTPVQIKANTLTKGKPFKISPLDKVPEIMIKYVARKLKTLKSIKPGLSEGEFDISVRIQNKGDVELENIIMKDVIPTGFELSEFKPPEGSTYKVIPKGAQSELEVQIKELSANASINIQYICSGSGEYPRSEPQVVVKGREGVGGPSATGITEKKGIEGAVTSITQAGVGKVHDAFVNIFKKIDQSINCTNLAEELEKMRDKLPAGPVLHQLMAYAKEIKVKAEKVVVGPLREEIMTKLKEYKNKYA